MMSSLNHARWLRPGRVIAALAALPLAGCHAVVLDPAGDVARQQGDLVVISTILMLIIIVPVMALTAFFAWRYRASNNAARYEPEWSHSTQLELVIWAAPLLIIICLGALTWVGTHLLDPYRPVSRLDQQTPVTPDARPLDVEVVALDWKWLFIYPEQGIASVNELVVPTGRPLKFKITASSVMNSFYVPTLAGQIYAMPGMETKLHAALNRPVESKGFSANYSGAGFSQMRFAFRGVSPEQFADWAKGVKAGKGALDRSAYLKLEQPSENVPVSHYASVESDLYDAVLNMCVRPGKMCMSEMMAIDAQGGLGKAGIRNLALLTYDKHGRDTAPQATVDPKTRETLAYVKALCGPDAMGEALDGQVKAANDLTPLMGAGLSRPAMRGPIVHAQLVPASVEHLPSFLKIRN